VYHTCLKVTLAALTDSEVNEFRKEVARRMLLPPWDSYIKSNINVCYTLSNCFTPTLNAFLHSSSRFRSFIHLSLFAEKFQYNTTKSKRTELDEKVVKHWHPSVLKSNAKFRPSNFKSDSNTATRSKLCVNTRYDDDIKNRDYRSITQRRWVIVMLFTLHNCS